MEDSSCVLVCVTGQRTCDRLIRRGQDISQKFALPLTVLHVRTAYKTMMGNEDVSASLNYLYGLAREAEAEMEILSPDGRDVPTVICAYAKAHNARFLVLGTGRKNGADSALVASIRKLAPETELDIVEVGE